MTYLRGLEPYDKRISSHPLKETDMNTPKSIRMDRATKLCGFRGWPLPKNIERVK